MRIHFFPPSIRLYGSIHWPPEPHRLAAAGCFVLVTACPVPVVSKGHRPRITAMFANGSFDCPPRGDSELNLLVFRWPKCEAVHCWEISCSRFRTRSAPHNWYGILFFSSSLSHALQSGRTVSWPSSNALGQMHSGHRRHMIRAAPNERCPVRHEAIACSL